MKKMKLKGLVAVCVLAAAVSAWAADAEKVQASADKAVAYLKSIQNEDGTFGKTKGAKIVGIVGLVLDGLVKSPAALKESDPVVAKAAQYILSKQQSSGAIMVPEYGMENYNTSVAVIALAGLQNPAYKDVLEKAKKSIVNNQLDEELGYNKDEHGRAYGSFGYGNSKRGDLSNTAFSIEALDALGFAKDSPEYKNAVLFIKRSQDNDETNDWAEMKGGNNEGGFVYLPMDSEFGNFTTKSGKKMPKPYGNMTYQAVKCLLLAGIDKNDPSLQAAYKWIRNNYSAKEQPGGVGAQGYFYYTNAFASAFTAMGVKEFETADGRKVNWAKDLAEQIIAMQKPDGSFVNSDKRWMEDDSTLATAYALRALNLCYKALK
jgi:squalene-hopene/tetraprenyl-beta-curcumene cyclase